ncbi:hypothetical protein V6N13_040669 [Hibiscus sabdariffa]
MKSSARLDSVVFQLTPTRTRCDLVISANRKTEKMASGLLNPFLAHLKTAQVQMSQGGYSIILKPESAIDASWFTKGTVERFVRFVSTPEILERVYMVESEILQIEEAIAIQSNNNTGLSVVEDHRVKLVESTGTGGSRATPDSIGEKAIVLYSPSALRSEANASSVEGNSKAQLWKVLETRKTVLQKEQSMAFARAVAAGFGIDHMAPLISFAETFGPLVLGTWDACIKFTELWKRKQETGQWLEIEAAEAMSSRSDFPSMNAAGTVFSENNGKSGVESSTDEKPSMDQQTPGRQESYQSQYPHPMFPPWPIHSPPGGLPPFQGYPMQGMPYYPNYPGCSPFFQQPYPSMEDPRYNIGKRIQKRHSTESRESHSGSDTWEMEREEPQDNEELENGTSLSPKPRKKSSRSGKKQSGMVVIRNINYITSKRENSSGSNSQSHSGSEKDEEDGDTENKYSRRYSKANGSRTKSVDAYDREETVNGK